MGFKDFVKDMVKQGTKAGDVVSSDFPLGSYINFGTEEGENYILFTKPDKTSEKITHDMVKCATVLAMGVIDVAAANSGHSTNTGVITGNVCVLYGTKYLCVLKDGRQAVLTVGLGKDAYRVERVLF